MAQGKRKLPKGKAKLSREESLQLQYAKKAGLISKRVTSDKGVVTRATQRKLDSLRALQAVPTYEFREGSRKSVRTEPLNKPVKLTKAQRAEYRQHNYPVFNGFTVAEKPREAREVLASGKLIATLPPLTGSNPVRVVSLGRIRTFADLKVAAEDGSLDKLKNPSDLFSFTVNDYSPRPFRRKEKGDKRSAFVHDTDLRHSTYFTGQELVDYLAAYDFMKDQGDLNDPDAFLILELYRIQEGRDVMTTPQWVFDRKRERGELAPERRKAKRKSRAKAIKAERQRLSAIQLADNHRDSQERYLAKQTPQQRQERLDKQKVRDKRRNRKK